jgi:hypothetical protein
VQPMSNKKSPSHHEQLIQYNFKSSDLHRNQFIMMNEPSLSIMGPSGMDVFNKSPIGPRYVSNSPLALNMVKPHRNLVIENHRASEKTHKQTSSSANFKAQGANQKPLGHPSKIRDEKINIRQDDSTVEDPSPNPPVTHERLGSFANENIPYEVNGQLIFGSTHSFIEGNGGRKDALTKRFSLNSKGADLAETQMSDGGTGTGHQLKRATLQLEEDKLDSNLQLPEDDKVNQSQSRRVTEAEPAE